MDPGAGHPVNALTPLFRELNDLKRVRVAGCPGSLAERLFARAWARLIRGEDPAQVALNETAHAVAATRLAGIDANVLRDAGLAAETRLAILRRGFDDAAGGLVDPTLTRLLRDALDPEPRPDNGPLPSFVPLLASQPRAGATRPGRARIVLEPVENHAEHCAIVAVGAVLAAPVYAVADLAAPFLTGLAHHLHNARLPDAGDAGDALLGEHLRPIMETFRAAALGELPEPLRGRVRRSLDDVFRADTPESRAFQTADVLDRVLEMDWHARAAAFTLDVALGEMDIVHPGPVQAFQVAVLRGSGLGERSSNNPRAHASASG